MHTSTFITQNSEATADRAEEAGEDPCVIEPAELLNRPIDVVSCPDDTLSHLRDIMRQIRQVPENSADELFLAHDAEEAFSALDLVLTRTKHLPSDWIPNCPFSTDVPPCQSDGDIVPLPTPLNEQALATKVVTEKMESTVDVFAQEHAKTRRFMVYVALTITVVIVVALFLIHHAPAQIHIHR